MSRALIDGFSSRLLGTHIGGGAEDHADARVIAGVVIVGDIVGARRHARRGGLHRFRQTEVEHLHRAIGPHLDVRGLEIAVDDPLLVRRFERLGDLLRDRQRLVDGDRSLRDAIGERRALRPAP